MAHEIEKAALAAYLEQHNLKHTRQRDLILDAFLDASGHITSDELHQAIRERDASIGYTTVYRTLKLLVDAGLAASRQFGDGLTRFEAHVDEHHDHIICEECGHIVEFHNDEIERIQENLVADHGFTLTSHRHELFVRCNDAQCPRRPARRDEKKPVASDPAPHAALVGAAPELP